MKYVYLFLVVVVFSCNIHKQSKQELILKVKNTSLNDMDLTLKTASDSFTIFLPKDSIYEIISLDDNCNSYVDMLNKKYTYISYQKIDSIPKVLIDKNRGIITTMSDMSSNCKAFQTRTTKNGKVQNDRFEAVYCLK